MHFTPVASDTRYEIILKFISHLYISLFDSIAQQNKIISQIEKHAVSGVLYLRMDKYTSDLFDYLAAMPNDNVVSIRSLVQPVKYY